MEKVLILLCIAIGFVTGDSCDIPTCSNEDRLLPVPWHTGQYILCHERKGYLRQCPRDNYFDEGSQNCLTGTATSTPCSKHQQLAIISKLAPRLNRLNTVNIDEVIKDIEYSVKKESQNTKKYNFQKWNRADNISEQCRNHSVTPVACPEVESADGLLPHPDDCQLFYYCVSPGMRPVCRDCPAGLHFNPAKHVCDVPEDAGCTVTPSTTRAPPTEGTTADASR